MVALHAKVTRAPRALPRQSSPCPSVRTKRAGCRRVLAQAAAAEGTYVNAGFFDEGPGEQTARCRFEINLRVEFGDEVIVVGDAEALGSWALSKAKKLSWHEGDVWSAEVDLPLDSLVEYKYAVTSHKPDDAKWSPGKNFSLLATQDCSRTDQWGVPAEDAPLPDRDHQISNLEKKTVKEIKSILKAKGLPLTGRKAELIERLQSLPTNP